LPAALKQRSVQRAVVGVSVSALGLIGWCVFLYARFGDALAWLHAEKAWGQPSGPDTWLKKAFFHTMLARGVYLPPSAYEAWFVSTAIDDEALETIAAALPDAARAAARIGDAA